MALDATQVRVAGTGGLYKGPLGQAEPADSVVALDAAFLNLGYFSADGAVMGFSDTVNNTFAWQSAALVRTSRTETLTTLAFNPIQSRGSVLEAFHSGSQITEITPGSEYRMPIAPAIADPASWVFDAIDGGLHYRYYIPNGEITERGDVMHLNGEPIGYPMTMTFYPDATGFLVYLLSDDGALGDDIT